MKRNLIPMFILFICISASYGQLKERDNLLGPSLGFWPSGSAPTFGLNYENQLTQEGPGTISLGGVFRFTTWRSNITSNDYWSVSYYTFGVQSNYNFNEIGEGKFVPFVGLVLGINSVSYSHTGPNLLYTYSGSGSGFWLWLQGGMRYFFTPKVAGSLRLGFGPYFDYNTIEIGVDFKL